MRLNDTVAKNAQPNGSKDTYLQDSQTPGLYLRVYKSGKRSWFFKSDLNGKRHKYALGDVLMMSYKEARGLAQQVYVELRHGHDRFEQARLDANEAKRISEEKANAPTIKEYIDLYMTKNTRMREPTKKFYEQLRDYQLKPFWDTDPLGMTPEDIEAFFDDMVSRSTAIRATKAIKFVRTVLAYQNIDWKVPRTVNVETPKAKRARLDPEHGQKIYAQLAAMTQTHTVKFALFLLLTGCRTGEADRLLVGDIDLVEACATLRNTKNHTDHKVYLSEALMEALRPLVKDRNPAHKLFICKDGPRYALRRIVDVPKFGAHDLRKCFAIAAGEIGVDYQVIKTALNHSAGSDVTMRHYLHVRPGQLRQCFQQVSDYFTT